MKGERGFALVLTLVVTALLVALVTEFIREVSVDAGLRKSYRDAQQASLYAESGITGAKKLLTFTLGSQGYTSFLDQWARPLSIDEEEGSVEVTIEDESGKLDLNSVAGDNGNFIQGYPILKLLLKRLELSPDLCETLADWRDTNDELHSYGAETSYYRQLKPPYAAKNGRLDSVEELGLIKGFNAQTVEKLRPFVTVYGNAVGFSPININTASKEILVSLSEQMTDELANRIIEYRTTTPFKSASDLAKVPGMETVMIGLGGKITARGSAFRIRSRGKAGETVRTIETVALMNGSSPQTVYWREF